jgi:hypothetical protein
MSIRGGIQTLRARLLVCGLISTIYETIKEISNHFKYLVKQLKEA